MSLFYQNNDSVLLYKGDSLSLMNEFPNKSFDMIFADPPYFLSNDGITCKSGEMVSVNKGIWDKGNSINDIHSFNCQWLRLCKDKLKDNGTIFISGTYHNIYSIGFALQTLDFKILNDISWFKVNPPPNLSCRFFTHSTEQIIWAKKSSKAKHKFNYSLMKEMGDPNPGKQMLSLWRITPPKKEEKKFGKHPTQKPLKLLERIVLASTDENDVILDPFLGSGTTGVASVLGKRRFVGIDSDESFLNLAKLRIEDAYFSSSRCL
jgi:site-specific DNA-methyltransferase (adenine-specific)